MTMTRLALIAAITTLAGCATDPEIARLALDRKPTLAVTCPAGGGCTVEYRDPRDTPRLPTNGYDAMVAISGQVTGLIGGAVVPAAMGAVAVDGFRAMRGHGQSTTTTSTTTDSHDTTTTTTTDSTHQPVVVTQPAPVIVTQPAPVIVGAP